MYEQYGEGAQGIPAHCCSGSTRRWQTNGRFKMSKKSISCTVCRGSGTLPEATVGAKEHQRSTFQNINIRADEFLE